MVCMLIFNPKLKPPIRAIERKPGGGMEIVRKNRARGWNYRGLQIMPHLILYQNLYLGPLIKVRARVEYPLSIFLSSDMPPTFVPIANLNTLKSFSTLFDYVKMLLNVLTTVKLIWKLIVLSWLLTFRAIIIHIPEILHNMHYILSAQYNKSFIIWF